MPVEMPGRRDLGFSELASGGLMREVSSLHFEILCKGIPVAWQHRKVALSPRLEKRRQFVGPPNINPKMHQGKKNCTFLSQI